MDPFLFSTSASPGSLPAVTASVVVVVGNPKAGSRTRHAAELVGRRVAGLTSAPGDVVVMDLTDLGARLLEWQSPTIADLKSIMRGAQALVVASPTYKATYTGLLKLFLDQFDRDELVGIPTIALMTGGDPGHSLAVETSLRPLLVELGASLPTRGLFLCGDDVESPEAEIARWWSTARVPLERIIWR